MPLVVDDIIMPEYLYQHPETKEVISIMQGMSDTHEFIDEEGEQGKRLLTTQNLSMDSAAVDPFSAGQFLEKTANMKGTYGDMVDYSKELSQQRAELRGGEDPIKRKMLNEYKAERGIDHVSDRPKSTSYETSKYRVDY